MLHNKINILSTKDLDETLIKDATSRNVFIDVSPFIKIEPISSIEVQEKIKQASTRTVTVVFTSVNAVEVVISELAGQKPDWEIFCIGHATHQLTETYFGKKSILGLADSAKDLANIIINKTSAAEVIFFCGNKRRNELPDLLQKNDIGVNEIVVYQTESIPHRTEKKYDGILFYSPSAVQGFFEMNQLGGQVILFAIGVITAKEIKRFSKNKIVVSDIPDKKNLLETTINYFQTNPVHH